VSGVSQHSVSQHGASQHSASQRDVVFTPFMLRVRAALDGESPPVPVPVRASEPRRLARAADEWFRLRCRSEQVVAEANAMLRGRTGTLDLADEAGTGRLAFTVRWGDRSACLSLGLSPGQAGRQGWVRMERSYLPAGEPEEPAGPAALEDLMVELLQPFHPTP